MASIRFRKLCAYGLAALVVGGAVWLLSTWTRASDPAGSPGAEEDDSSVERSSEGDARLPDAYAEQVTAYESPSELTDSAREVLESYRDGEACLVRQAGYLDLMGNVWSCVMEGPGWVDVCVVRSHAQDGGSSVRIVRMAAGGEDAPDTE